MNSNIETKTIEEVVDVLIDYRGKTPTKSKDGIRLITAKVIKDGFIQTDNSEYIAESAYDTWMRRGLPKKGDVLITTEAPLGEVAQIRTDERVALAQRVILLRSNSSLMDQQYLYHALKSPFVQAGLTARSSGTTVSGIKQSELRQVRLPYFHLKTQCKIASILSAYDDLIENNTRRIKILEEMAHSIYREWFVNFRFPGYAKVRMVDSRMGKIPEGWEIIKIENIASLHRGRSYRTENLVEIGGIPFVNLKCIERNGGFRIDGLKSYSGPFSESQTVGVNDIIIAVTDMTQERRLVAHAARIPRLTSDTAVFSMDLVKLKPKRSNWQEYLYGVLRYSDFPDSVKQMANGVNVLHLNPSHIGTFEFVVAPQDIIGIYSQTLEPVYQLMDILEVNNTVLRQTRDLLLPCLISGELDVSNLDIAINEIENGVMS